MSDLFDDDDIAAIEDQAKRATRAAFWTRLFLIVASALLALSLTALLVLALSIHNTQIDGTPTGRKLLASADRIIDCTDPDGKCTKENEKRTAGIVTQLDQNDRRNAALAAACAAQVSDPRDPAQILACMNRYLKQKP